VDHSHYQTQQFQMSKKKKILLLSDDLRMNSGVATMSRELVMGTLHEYDWAQIAGAVKHPESGKVVDMNNACNDATGKTDNYLRLYPVDGYGNPDMLFSIMEHEKPDAIMHFTDPRFWQWLYEIEHQIRSKIPLTYMNIWDCLPYPVWNKPFYQSCDTLFSISKQTYNINKWVLGPEYCTTVDGDIDCKQVQ
jgi:hypothetical protein